MPESRKHFIFLMSLCLVSDAFILKLRLDINLLFLMKNLSVFSSIHNKCLIFSLSFYQTSK